jgi:CRISPR-associated protein Cmr6
MIPLSPDVRQLVGDWADQVDNRSLLYEKFSLPKVWGEDDKLDNAGRWSVLRIVTRGAELLQKDARSQAERRVDKNPEKADKLFRDAQVADRMAKVAQPDRRLAQVANQKAARFVAELERSFSGRVVTFEATLGSRLLVNLAGGVVENAGIALDRCFGLPFIPGSAVKGITRALALWEIRQARPEDRPRLLRMAMPLFGFGAKDTQSGDFAWAAGPQAQEVSRALNVTDFKGCACFLPAYPTTQPELLVDMVNPHYPDYYGGRRNRATDDGSPVPNYFPAVREGVTFAFAVLLNRSVPDNCGVADEDLLRQAKQWIERAVTLKGVGAKTAAGYGWFELGRRQPAGAPARETAPPSSAETMGPGDVFIQKWKGRLNTKDNFPVALPEMAAITDDAELKRAFEAVIPENDRRRNRKNHPYWQSFTSGAHGESGKKILARVGFQLK